MVLQILGCLIYAFNCYVLLMDVSFVVLLLFVVLLYCFDWFILFDTLVGLSFL